MQLILTVSSLTAQIVAIIVVFSYIRKRTSIALFFIAIALALVVIRKLLNLIGYTSITTLPEIVTMVMSLLMLLGVLAVSKTFKAHEDNIIRLKSMHDIDRVILLSSSHKGIMNAIIDKLEQTINPDAIGVYIFDKNGQNLDVQIGRNLSKRHMKQVMTDGGELIRAVIRNRKLLILNKIRSDDNIGFVSSLKQEGFVAYIGTPIIAQGGVVTGVLSLYSKKPRKYVKKDLEFINGISHRIGIALDRGQFIQRIREMNFESVLALVQAIEMRDSYTRGHSLQVASLSVIIAQEIEFTEREVELIKFAGLLHDIGKIAIPESILHKPTFPTEKEWRIIKLHPEKSAMIIEPIKGLRQVSNWILHHHERWDGSGYPENLKAEHIPIQSRILAVSDTYSAMIGDRPYRKCFGDDEARREIKRVSGTQLDPHITDIFLNLDRTMLRTKFLNKLRGRKRG